MIDDLLVCPVCYAPLPLAVLRLDGKASCGECQYVFTFTDAIFDMTPLPPPDSETQSRWGLWKTLQKNGEISYTVDQDASLSVGERDDVRAFAEFANLYGSTLDIGCGPQPLPAYAGNGRFVGIDPLRGIQPRGFDFVQGLGEFLPFRADTFDRVLFATSLDHCLNPVRCLLEARRVLKADGEIIVWYGEPESDLSVSQLATKKIGNAWRLLMRGNLDEFAKRLRAQFQLSAEPVFPAHDYKQSLSVPDGAVDIFHAFYVTRPLLSNWLTLAQLRATDWQDFLGQSHSCFVRICAW
jgi:SAM-dependent methyltransferase